MSLLERGASYETLTELAVEICYNVTDNLGWRGEVICQGMIDNYAPSVSHTSGQLKVDLKFALLFPCR